MKQVFTRVFPDTQQQFYLFHIIKNVLFNTKKKWKKQDEEEENSFNEEGKDEWENPVLFNQDDRNLYTIIRSGNESTTSTITNNPNRFTKMFKLMVYAKTELEFWDLQEKFKKRFAK